MFLSTWLGSWLNPQGRPQRPTFRPWLESLEERLALDGTFVWKATQSTLWDVAANWQRTAGTGDYPSAGGSTNDIAILNNQAGDKCDVNTTVTVKELKIEANYGRDLTIKEDKRLTVRVGAAEPHVDAFGLTMASGKLKFEQNTELRLANGKHKWSGGEIDPDGNGITYMYHTALLTITENARDLGSILIVGRSATSVDSSASVHFDELNNNVKLLNNANIGIYQFGSVDFSQQVDSDTKGGIEIPQGSQSQITNRGKIRRVLRDVNNKTLKIAPPVTGEDNSQLELGRNCRIEFTGQYILNAGTFHKGTGSHQKGVVLDGGKISIEDPGVAGSYDTYFDDGLSANSGIIEFIQTTPGAYGTIHIAGDLFLGSGTTVILNINGSTAEISDTIQVDGSVTIDQSHLEVTTHNASPILGWTYSFISFGTFISGTWATPIVNHGYAADYVFADIYQLLVDDD